MEDSRATRLERLRSQRFDLLVVGGGIIGAGVAELAARHGFAVALVERDDFASGTSSASSKLIHGGLRYLRMGHFGLVREALDEVRALSEVVAPHLVRPLRFVLPVYRGGPYGRIPDPRRPLVVRRPDGCDRGARPDDFPGSRGRARTAATA